MTGHEPHTVFEANSRVQCDRTLCTSRDKVQLPPCPLESIRRRSNGRRNIERHMLKYIPMTTKDYLHPVITVVHPTIISAIQATPSRLVSHHGRIQSVDECKGNLQHLGSHLRPLGITRPIICHPSCLPGVQRTVPHLPSPGRDATHERTVLASPPPPFLGNQARTPCATLSLEVHPAVILGSNHAA